MKVVGKQIVEIKEMVAGKKWKVVWETGCSIVNDYEAAKRIAFEYAKRKP